MAPSDPLEPLDGEASSALLGVVASSPEVTPVAAGVAVTVTVETDRATVTVTGAAQSAAPVPAAAFPPDPDPEPDSPLVAPVGTAETVMYRVDVDVPLMVVVFSSVAPSALFAPPAPPAPPAAPDDTVA
jgi:hypothetical protein